MLLRQLNTQSDTRGVEWPGFEASLHQGPGHNRLLHHIGLEGGSQVGEGKCLEPDPTRTGQAHHEQSVATEHLVFYACQCVHFEGHPVLEHAHVTWMHVKGLSVIQVTDGPL